MDNPDIEDNGCTFSVEFMKKLVVIAVVFISQSLSPGTTLNLTGTVYCWAKTWGGNVSGAQANNIVSDGLGNLYVIGEFTGTVAFNPAGGDSRASHGAQDVFLSKFAPDGTFLWVKTWRPAEGGAESYSIAMDGSDHVYVVGDFTGSSCDFNSWGSHDVHNNHPPDPANPYGWLFDAACSTAAHYSATGLRAGKWRLRDGS
jgi:hypothetical protein